MGRTPRGSRARWRAVAVVGVLTLVAAACDNGGGDDGSRARSRTVVVALDSEPTGFNVNVPTHQSQVVQDVVGTMWPSAYRIGPDFGLEPWLISAPASVVSTDPFVVEWRIRPDADWSDGTPVSADDFEFVYRHCSGVEADSECGASSGYAQITDLEKVDAKTVRATFDPPFAEYEALFRNVPPSHVAADRGGDWNTAFDDDPGPSAGPLRFGEWTRGESIVLVANEDYFGDAPEIERLVFRFLDPTAQADALRNDEVDVIFPPPTVDLVETLGGMDGVDTQAALGPDIEHITFNLTNEFLAMPPVRRAIALGIDRDAMVEALVEPINPDAVRLDNRVLVSNQDGYEAHGEEFAERDVERARAELESAGFERDEDGIYALDGERLALKISTTSGNARREQQVQLVEAQLTEVGISIEIDNAPEDAFRGAVAEGGFDLANFAWFGDPFPVEGVSVAYGTGGPINFGGFSDDRVDELLAEAAAATDAAERVDVLNELDAAMWEALPNVPLYQPPILLAHDETIEGIVANPTNQGHLWNVEAWDFAEAA